MKLEPRRLRGVRSTLDETLGWQLPEEGWATVRAVLDGLADALEHDDPRGVDEARDELARCDPRRRILKARPTSTPMPEDLRERHNVLVHEIAVRVPEPRRSQPSGG